MESCVESSLRPDDSDRFSLRKSFHFLVCNKIERKIIKSTFSFTWPVVRLTPAVTLQFSHRFDELLSSYYFVVFICKTRCYHNWVTYLFSNCTSKKLNRLDASCCLPVSVETSESKTN